MGSSSPSSSSGRAALKSAFTEEGRVKDSHFGDLVSFLPSRDPLEVIRVPVYAFWLTRLSLDHFSLVVAVALDRRRVEAATFGEWRMIHLFLPPVFWPRIPTARPGSMERSSERESERTHPSSSSPSLAQSIKTCSRSVSHQCHRVLSSPFPSDQSISMEGNKDTRSQCFPTFDTFPKIGMRLGDLSPSFSFPRGPSFFSRSVQRFALARCIF